MTTADEVVAERARLLATLREVGPDAPTSAGTWTARQLASHVARQDRLLGFPAFLARQFATATSLRLSELYLDRRAAAFVVNGPTLPWERALRRLSARPPSMVLREPIGVVSLWEHFVHHEDVRRPNGVARAALPDLGAVLSWIGDYDHRRVDRTVRIVTEDGDRTTIGAGPPMTVEGPRPDVVLWLSGRPVSSLRSDAPVEELERIRLRVRS